MCLLRCRKVCICHEVSHQLPAGHDQKLSRDEVEGMGHVQASAFLRCVSVIRYLVSCLLMVTRIVGVLADYDDVVCGVLMAANSNSKHHRKDVKEFSW